jgi:hypothetical protein
LPDWNDSILPKSNRSKAKKPVTKGHKAKSTKRSNGIHKIDPSSSESESDAKSDGSVAIESSSSSASSADSSDSDDSSAPSLPPRMPPTPNLTLQNERPVLSHSSKPDSSDSENSAATPMLSRKTPPPPLKSLMSPPTPILKKQSPYRDPLSLETEATNQTSLSRKVTTPLRSTPGSTSNKIFSYVSSVSSSLGFGGGTAEVPRESDEDNDEDGSNPEETVAEISRAGEHPPGEVMHKEVGSRGSVNSLIDLSKDESSKTKKKKKKKKQRTAEVDSDDSDENSDSTTNTNEKKHGTSSKKKKKKKKKKSMDASKNKKSGKNDDGVPVRRSRRIRK